MKKLSVIFALLLLAATAQATPVDTEDDIGLGVMAGTDLGVTGSKWLNESRSVDVAFMAAGEDESQIQADYKVHFNRMDLPARITPYVGAGLGLGMNREVDDVEHDADGFARLPVGLSWFSRQAPLGVFAEVAPSMIVTPDSEAFVDANVGARLFF